eukprot:Em0001g1064a
MLSNGIRPTDKRVKGVVKAPRLINRCGHTINDHLRAGILERMSSKGRPGFGVGETVQGKVKKMHGINRLGTEAAGEAVTEEGEFVDMVVCVVITTAAPLRGPVTGTTQASGRRLIRVHNLKGCGDGSALGALPVDKLTVAWRAAEVHNLKGCGDGSALGVLPVDKLTVAWRAAE